MASTSEKGARAGNSSESVSMRSGANEKEAKEVINKTKFSQAPNGAQIEAQRKAKTGLIDTSKRNTRRTKGFSAPVPSSAKLTD